jgi:peptide/nickel transport system permease protein
MSSQSTRSTGSAVPVQLRDDAEQREPASLARRSLRRFLRHRMAIIGLIMLTAVIIYVLGGALFFTESYANFADSSRSLTAPSAEHPMGTDNIGRDILARTIYGGQISLLIGVTAVLISVTLGTLVGMVSGFYGGWVDSILMRITEAMLSIPTLLLLLVLANILGGRIGNVNILGRTLSGSVLVIIVIIGFTSWTYLARIVRSTVLSLKESEFVLAARALGAPHYRIILSHILPNTIAPIIVAATLGVANAILSEAYISFLGLGVRPPTATWGNILEGSKQFIERAPWLWVFPGILIMVTLLGINFVGDGLRDALDPRTDK